ncbi:UDP-3-O-(3-hydroxymyristoyl)glucosamine N-acyltransferase [Permianibacter sp. IMCC34836]|uniref:UDP-3-O-(3-hydroxymyristoyl)glucosamine N-acyltransferase n=1 Tax=Permianibacter fluminis TaxID=2738515 RepID=UPI0015546A4C|nr:UDP-3-O-(3-hydroxymyristoyl)glucosamine N-acyltransferase [Permianibacter fluminis]NQD38687.1 UDP-3-O-(3-hydroxymyristoyl)glucosamine N-acyltransferase [Permianibacter fluminis]
MKLAELAQQLQARLVGDGDIDIRRVADLRTAGIGDISFLTSSEYREHLAVTRASAVMLKEADHAGCPVAALVVASPYLAYAKVAQLLDPTPRPAAGIHPTAVISPEAQLASDVSVGPSAVIERGCIVASGAIIGSHCVLGEQVQLGANSRLWPGVVLYHGVRLGERCTVHSGTVIGSDGFGYAQEAGQWVKIPQTGTVVLGDDVEIGANCTIDRGALGDTVIANGVKLDNLIHIAHNVQIGAHSAIAGCSGVAGSTVIGKQVTLAGRVSVLGHLTICDNAHVTACSLVNKSITEPGAYSSGTTLQDNRSWRKSAARFHQLDDLARRLRRLEKQLGAGLDENDND